MGSISRQITGNEAFWGALKGQISDTILNEINASPTLVNELVAYGTAVSNGTMQPMSVTLTGSYNLLQFTGQSVQFGSNWLNWSPEQFVGNLSHEIGHFENYGNDQAFYKSLNINHNDPNAGALYDAAGLRAEGEAVVNNWTVQQEIKQNLGVQIIINGDGSGTGAIYQALNTLHASDVTNGLSSSQDKNAMIELAGKLFSSLHPSDTPAGTTYSDLYAAHGGEIFNSMGIAPGNVVPGAISEVDFSDADLSGNISSVTEKFSNGESRIQYFDNSVISSSIEYDQFGNIVSQDGYTHNADGSFSVTFTDGAGHETAIQNIAANGSYSVTQFNTSTGYEISQTNYNAAGTPLYKDDYNANNQLATEEGYNAAGQEITQKIVVPGTTQISSTIFFDPTTGNETSEQHYNASGIPTYQDNYNTSGQLISEDGYNSAGQRVSQLLVTPGTLSVYEKLLFDPGTGQETAQQNFNTSGQMTSQDNFNTSGQLVSQDDFNSAGQETDRLLVTPGTTNIYQKLIFDPATGQETSAQSFDASGHLTYQDDYNTSGQLVTEESYNAAGQETMKKFLTPGTTHAETTYFYDTSNGSVNYIANYDASGNETLGTEYNTSGLRTVSHTFDTATGNESERNVYATPGSNTPTTSIYFNTTTRYETFQNDYDANGNQLSQENYDPEDGNLLSKEILGGSSVTQQMLYTPGWQYASQVINFLPNGSQSEHYYFNQNGTESRESVFNGSSTEQERLVYDATTNKLTGDFHFYANGNLENQTLFNSSGQELEYDEYNTAAQLIDQYSFNPGAQYSYKEATFTGGTYSAQIINFNQNTGQVTSWTQFDPNTGQPLSSGANWDAFGQILNGGGSGSNATSFSCGGGFPSGSGFIAFEGGSGSIFGGFGFSGSSEAALRSDAVANTLLDHLDLHNTRNGQAAFGQALDDARSAANAAPGDGTGRPNVEGRWGKSELTWSLSDLDSSGHVLSSSSMAEYEQAVTQAFSAWSAQTGFMFKEVAAGSPADIQIDWNALDTASTGVVGFTSGHTTGTTIMDAHIRLEDPTQTSLDGTLTYTGTQATLSQTALHEIGHALGLGDTTDARSVMYYALSDQNRALDATDTLGAQAVGIGHLTQAEGMAALMIQSMASFGAAPSASTPLYDPVRTAVHPMLAMSAH
ncbi:matrixin family metalloprotease [Burkholderia metallica]|uniref:matrixin family metalloprotease n=1 Tax=Burkholderia metallica TaxID=488729 RepID=UPI001CF21A98|nr:matrixin family metalloprotease [Burkholderia metallica]MCA8023634.1 matrixin family metalloprotease [Burkholderia metallica]